MAKKVDIRELDKNDVEAEGDDGFGGLGDDIFQGGSAVAAVVEDAADEADESGGDEDREKKTWKTITPRQKAVNVILRRAGKQAMPDVKQIMAGKWGTSVAIKDIAIFIGDDQSDEVMAELAKECPIRNKVNLSAEVTKKRVVDIGAQIVEAGRMYQPISVVKIMDEGANGKLECTSGRHRLVFLALMFGADTKIPVYMEQMTLNEARDAVVVANQARSTKALERAEHTVLQAVRGNLAASQDDLYYRTITAKGKAKRYCVFTVVNRSYPMKLSFPVSKDSSRADGGITTLANVEGFWGAALEWKDGMERKDFDAQLKESVRFLNSVVESMRKQKGFDSKQHLAAMVLTAMGKYYRVNAGVGKGPCSMADSVAKCVLSLGEIGRQKSEKTYQALMKSVGAPKK